MKKTRCNLRKKANKKKTQNAQPSRLSKESHNVSAIGAMHTLVCLDSSHKGVSVTAAFCGISARLTSALCNTLILYPLSHTTSSVQKQYLC